MDITNITSAQYTLDLDGNNSTIISVIDNVKVQVPLDPANRHYAEILRQVEAGTLVIAEAN